MAGRKVELTDDERAERERAYQAFFAESRELPLDYVKHDSNAHANDQLRRLVYRNGIDALGMWWVLVELLSARKHHRYDVSSDEGWEFLAQDMSGCGASVGVEECRRAVEALLDVGLLDADYYHDRHEIVNLRVLKNADEFADGRARKLLSAWMTNRSRAMA